LVLVVALPPAAGAADDEAVAEARRNAARFETAVAASRRLLHAWLKHADPRTLLLPDRVAGGAQAPTSRVYTPHNSGADLYPYLILTAHLTDPALVGGRMLEMLRSEVRHTGRVPGNLDLDTGELSSPSLFGAGEYAKDGLITVTEYLGRTPWFYRMADMVAAAMDAAPVPSRWGQLPARDAELNGDYLQVLVRLATMTRDPRYREWARRIATAYFEEVLPGGNGLPASQWDFAAASGSGRLKLRDHGNEIIVGLTMLYTLEHAEGTDVAKRYRGAMARMLDRVLASANADGMLFNEIDTTTLEPVDARLSDNWGYIYGAVYAFYQCHGDAKYREAVRRVLTNLPRYRGHVWEPHANREAMPLGSFDGYADAIESAIYLVNREPVPEAFDWIESEMPRMLAMQKPDGHVEYWYGEGNFNRTALLYAFMQSQGVRPAHWTSGLGVGAVRRGDDLVVAIEGPASWTGRVQFDAARHRRVLHFTGNFVRLNEFPEWFTIDENRTYRLSRDGGETIERLGSELIEGVSMSTGVWRLTPCASRCTGGCC
jgi:hypothetical protein